jgi:polysaccharide biosynthesis/export protein
MRSLAQHNLQLLVSRRLLIAMGAGIVAGCTPGRDLSPLPEYHPDAYRLGGGDQVRIIVFGEDQLTGEYRIDDQGRIALPLLGSVNGNDKTAQQLEQTIATQLNQRNFLHNPSVSVEVLAYRPIFVLGEVSRPGQYPYQPGMTMLTSVAIAGGFTYRAVEDYASVVRTAGNQAQEGRVVPSSFVAPGDVIKVFERRF